MSSQSLKEVRAPRKIKGWKVWLEGNLEFPRDPKVVRRVTGSACGVKHEQILPTGRPGGLPNASRPQKHNCYVTGMAVLVSILSKYLALIDKEPFIYSESPTHPKLKD